jgi:hypothetical protein
VGVTDRLHDKFSEEREHRFTRQADLALEHNEHDFQRSVEDIRRTR